MISSYKKKLFIFKIDNTMRNHSPKMVLVLESSHASIVKP